MYDTLQIRFVSANLLINSNEIIRKPWQEWQKITPSVIHFFEQNFKTYRGKITLQIQEQNHILHYINF